MEEKELKVLLAGAQRAGIAPNTLKAVNPFTMTDIVAKSMQVTVSKIDPVQAAA